MKKVYIPRGEIVTHSCLYTGKVVVNGVLRVSGRISAKSIAGSGVIEAGEIVCDDLRADHITADFITARRIAANKLFVRFECRASEAVAVRDFAAAGYMNTGKLSITLSDIQACDADQVIVLKQKSSLIGLLWASWWRAFFLGLFHGEKKERRDEGKKPAEPPKAETKAKAGAPVPGQSSDTAPVTVAEAGDAAADMLCAVLAELKKQGYQVSKSDPVHAGLSPSGVGEVAA